MKRRASRLNRKTYVRWQDICPTCMKYDSPDHPPEDCELCKASGITESVLRKLNRDDQENEQHDFECGAYRPKHPIQ